MIVASGDLVPKQDTALARSTSDLVRRGLQLVESSAQRDVFISETECTVLRTKYHEAWHEMARLRVYVPNRWTRDYPGGLVSGDLNEFLEAFDRVKLNEGYVLEYLLGPGTSSRGSLVYAREVDSEPMSSPEEYRNAYGLPINHYSRRCPTCVDSLPYLRHMRFDRNTEGYFQFALFCMTVRGFPRSDRWPQHLCSWPIFTGSDLRECFEDRRGIVSDADRLRLLKLNLKPRRRLRNGSAEVRMLYYTHLYGYHYFHTHIRWPNSLEKLEYEIVAERL